MLKSLSIFRITCSLLALLFLASAVGKTLDIEAFELILFQQSFIPWNFTELGARLLIIGELFLSFSLLKTIFTHQKWILKTCLVILSLFSIYLIIEILMNGSSENCGCFGDLVDFNSWESLAKNALMIVVTGVGLKHINNIEEKPKKFIWIDFIFVAHLFLGIMLVYPIHNISFRNNQPSKEINLDALEDQFSPQEIALIKDNKVVIIASYNCKHCLDLTQKIITYKNKNLISDILLLGKGGEDKKKVFLEKSGYQGPIIDIKAKAFVELTKGSVPQVYLNKNDMLIGPWTNSNFNPEVFISTFEDSGK